MHSNVSKKNYASFHLNSFLLPKGIVTHAADLVNDLRLFLLLTCDNVTIGFT